ncbi:MAG: molybdopterin-dependent oxidoreductase [Rhodospirillaceae bacterium]|nr:molybdopterin-dependent oxidoreductase [Rhodospirillaceae bacterium]MDE0361141.1 molybdopterin-dependent oxidoreductase [Rhodospirillaceae bacterium]
MASIDRRDFLKLVGAGGVGTGAGFMLREAIKHPVENLVPYPVPPEDFSPGIATWYNTVCSMCSAGCGITVRTREGRAKKIEGNPSHPVSQGRLCARGQAGLQVLYNPDRVTTPLRQTGERGSGDWLPLTWTEGLSQVSARLGELRSSGQGAAVCLLSEGQRGHMHGLFEQFTAEIGSDRLVYYDYDHPHPLLAAMNRLFGTSELPYFDLGNTDYLVSFGADYLGSWLSPVHHGLGFGQSRQGRDDHRGRFVQIEPRMTLSGAAADEWIPANPGTEGIIALAMANRIVSQGGYQGDDVDAWAAALEPYSADAVAEQTGVAAETITRLADTFAETGPSLAIGGDGAGRHSNGVDALTAITALNYLAGNLGIEGGLIFNPEPVAGQGAAARHASYRSMLELAEDAREGRIQVLIVNQTNPVFTMPAAAGIGEALARIPLIVSLSSFMDETTAMADLILPSHTYLESWGDDFPEPGVGFRAGAISQPVVSPLYDTRDTGDTLLAVAAAVNPDGGLTAATTEEYLRQRWRAIFEGDDTADAAAADAQEATAGETDEAAVEVAAQDAPEGAAGDAPADAEVAAAQITPAEGAAPTDPDPAGWMPDAFDEFWNSLLRAGVWGENTRAEQGPVTVDASVIDAIGVDAPEFAGSSESYPFILQPYLSLNMHDGSGANLPWMQELPDPLTSVVYGSWLEINPATAQELGLRDGDLVEVESPDGTVSVPVLTFPAIMPNVVAMPVGQGHSEYGRYASGRGANPIEILSSQMEPETGSLAWNATRVRLNPTGRRASLVRTSGVSRDLGRGIIQTTATAEEEHASTNLRSIPITVEPA